MDNNEIEKLKEKIEKTEDFEERILSKIKLAEVYEKEQDYNRAIQIYKELLRIKNPPFRRTKILLALGNSYDRLEQYEQALKWYEQVLKDRQIDQDKFSLIQAAIAIGVIKYHVIDDVDEGFRYLKMAEAEMKANNSLLDEEDQSYLLGRLGVVHSDRKEYSKAIEYLEQSIQLDRQLEKKDDDFYSSFHIIGLCYYYLNDYKKAIKTFEKVVREYKHYKYISEVYPLLAHSYWNSHNYRKAIRYLELALQSDPKKEDIPYLEYLLGTSYHSLKLYDEGKAHIQKFLELETKDKEKIEYAKNILAGKEW